MQKILIIIPRYSFTNHINYCYSFPLGLAYISSVLKKEGYSVDCLNLNHKKGEIKDIIKTTLKQKEYSFVCTGNMAIGYAATKNIICAVRKQKSNIRIILGGLIITSEPELMFNDLGPDFAVVGEGEETILDLLNCLINNGDLKKVDGIIYRNNKDVVFTNKRSPPENIAILPFPDFEGFEFEKQLMNIHCNDNYSYNELDYPRPYPILGSRGCPFQCSFCYHEGKFRARSIENIMKELNENVKKYQINLVNLYDDCFATNMDRVYEFCKEIKKLSKVLSRKISWTCQMRVDRIDKETLAVMKEAGCNSISYGFESFSPIVLKSMRKYISPEQIEKAFRNTLDAKIGIQANFIFGDIAENKETVKQTINWWIKNSNGNINLSYIRPYPGSEIYTYCIKKGLIKNKLEFIKSIDSNSLVLNMSNELTDEEDKRLKTEIIVDLQRKYCQFVTPISIKKDKKKTFTFKVECPFCKKNNVYKNCFINNRFIYLINLICRECAMRFFIIGPILKIYKKNFEKYIPQLYGWLSFKKLYFKKMIVSYKRNLFN